MKTLNEKQEDLFLKQIGFAQKSKLFKLANKLNSNFSKANNGGNWMRFAFAEAQQLIAMQIKELIKFLSCITMTHLFMHAVLNLIAVKRDFSSKKGYVGYIVGARYKNLLKQLCNAAARCGLDFSCRDSLNCYVLVV